MPVASFRFVTWAAALCCAWGLLTCSRKLFTYGNGHLAPSSLLGGGPGSRRVAHAIRALLCLFWLCCLRRAESLALCGCWCSHSTTWARVPSLKSRPIRSRGAATTGGLDVRTVGGGHLALFPPCSDLLPANLAVALGTCLALRLSWFTEFLARYHAFVPSAFHPRLSGCPFA